MTDPPVLPNTIRTLREACRGTGWSLTPIDQFSGYLVVVSNGRHEVMVGAGRLSAYPLNAATPFGVAADKAHCYAALERHGIAIPRGRHFFPSRAHRAARPDGRELGDAVTYAESLGYPVFIKPNSGSRGQLAAIIDTRDDLVHHLITIGQHGFIAALVQEVLTGPEYRFFMLDGTVRFAYRKTPPPLGADDKGRREGGQGPAANLSLGGGITDFRETVPAPLAAWCRRIAEAVGLRVCAIDAMARHDTVDPAEPASETLCVLEVNGNPAMTAPERFGRTDLVHALWRDILQRSFEDAAHRSRDDD